jgi:hypothetical protein
MTTDDPPQFLTGVNADMDMDTVALRTGDMAGLISQPRLWPTVIGRPDSVPPTTESQRGRPGTHGARNHIVPMSNHRGLSQCRRTQHHSYSDTYGG